MSEITEAALRTAGLPAVVNSLIARSGGSPSALRLHLTYLRRKPGRGLIAMYRVDSSGSSIPFIHLAVDERALEGSGVVVSGEELERADSLSGRWPGPISDMELGITLQAFPDDTELPALAATCKPSAGTIVRAALDDARRELGVGGSVVAAVADAVRYKPGDRCVIRYLLRLTHGATLGIVGKVYSSRTKARELYLQTQRVYAEQLAQGERPLLPRPLGLVDELGLILTEDLAMAGPATPGTTVLRPVGARVEPPVGAIHDAAAALARLHSGVFLPESLRGGALEASRARKRALRVAEFVPELAERAAGLAERVDERLRPNDGMRGVPAHGSFKPAQLMFQSGRVLVTDFDQFCTADPALDVGYFLAYLRPPSLWYRRRTARIWFEASASEFVRAYVDAACARGEPAVEAEAIWLRSRVYQAAVLFKIANRRFNRLQSPRPGELAAILDEIESCLGLAG